MSSNSAFESLGGGSTSGNPSVEEAYLFLEHKVDPFGQLDPRDQEHPLVGPEYIQEECESLSEGSSSVRRSRSSEIIHPPAGTIESLLWDSCWMEGGFTHACNGSGFGPHPDVYLLLSHRRNGGGWGRIPWRGCGSSCVFRRTPRSSKA